ncbi:hypothetical protein [Halobellus ordinarius]|uniref:hypothetical protein n=1 Tax=Halobellus ordinarius TaxID=3075120 RepID=UPI0028806793|nr:hypothetical protein [Halobellus sp. ZY16]
MDSPDYFRPLLGGNGENDGGGEILSEKLLMQSLASLRASRRLRTSVRTGR